MDITTAKICITGGTGFLGKQVVSALKQQGAKHLFIPPHQEYDLTSREACTRIVQEQDIIIHLAAAVGGIGYLSKHPGSSLYKNLIISTQLMEEARRAGVKKFVSIGTTCAYPKDAPLPLKEDDLWAGYPAEATAPYGLAKRMLLLQGQMYRKEYGFSAIYLLPVNLYGPGDNYNPDSSHVIAALIRKVLDAKERSSPHITIWGTGKATRDFIYVEDAARAIVMATKSFDGPEPINIGTGIETSIKDIVEIIIEEAGYTGELKWDDTRPEGQPRRVVDTTRAEHFLGFKATTDLRSGIRKAIAAYEEQRQKAQQGRDAQ